MRLTVDLDTLALSGPAAASTVDARRGDRFPVEVRFVRGGIVQELPAAAVGRLVLKRSGDYGGLSLASVTWRRLGRATAAYYLFDLDLHSGEIDSLFETPGARPVSVPLALEIEWTHRQNRRSTRPLPLTLLNDYAKPIA